MTIVDKVMSERTALAVSFVNKNTPTIAVVQHTPDIIPVLLAPVQNHLCTVGNIVEGGENPQGGKLSCLTLESISLNISNCDYLHRCTI
jgi:hypothetical protein